MCTACVSLSFLILYVGLELKSSFESQVSNLNEIDNYSFALQTNYKFLSSWPMEKGENQKRSVSILWSVIKLKHLESFIVIYLNSYTAYFGSNRFNSTVF